MKDTPLHQLLAGAGQSFSGLEANQKLWDLRDAMEQNLGRAVLYEMVPSPDQKWGDFLKKELPKITEHLLAKGLPLLGSPPLIVVLWAKDRAHIFEGTTFFDRVQSIEGYSDKKWKSRIQTWRKKAGLTVEPS